MAYQDLDSLESQPTTMRRDEDPQYRDDPEFDDLATSLSNQLLSLGRDTADLSRQIGLMGTKRDSDRLHERIENLRKETLGAAKSAEETFKKIKAWEDVNARQKFTQAKLSHSLTSTLHELQTAHRSLSEKERASAAALRSDIEHGAQSTGDGDFQLQEQQFEQPSLVSQDEIDHQQAYIEYREQGIESIQRGILDIHNLTLDVANMVQEQDPDILKIAQNTADTVESTRGGQRELNTASRYQRSATSKYCCLFVILAIILAIIVLAVVLG